MIDERITKVDIFSYLALERDILQITCDRIKVLTGLHGGFGSNRKHPSTPNSLTIVR